MPCALIERGHTLRPQPLCTMCMRPPGPSGRTLGGPPLGGCPKPPGGCSAGGWPPNDGRGAPKPGGCCCGCGGPKPGRGGPVHDTKASYLYCNVNRSPTPLTALPLEAQRSQASANVQTCCGGYLRAVQRRWVHYQAAPPAPVPSHWAWSARASPAGALCSRNTLSYYHERRLSSVKRSQVLREHRQGCQSKPCSPYLHACLRQRGAAWRRRVVGACRLRRQVLQPAACCLSPWAGPCAAGWAAGGRRSPSAAAWRSRCRGCWCAAAAARGAVDRQSCRRSLQTLALLQGSKHAYKAAPYLTSCFYTGCCMRKVPAKMGCTLLQ